MPRQSKKPWFRTQDQCWYTTVRGRKIKLGTADTHPDIIRQAYHSYQAAGPMDSAVLVKHLAGQFLEYARVNNKPSTYNWYKRNLDGFVKYAGARKRATDLTSGFVLSWARQQTVGQQHGAARCVARMCNWAAAEHILVASPIRGMVKPAATSREVTISQAQYARCIKAADAHPALLDVLRFMWRTGCRPQEVRQIEAGWLDGSKIVFPVKQSKGGKKRRVIYLTDIPKRIVVRNVGTYPEGPIFRNSKGRPWRKDALVLAFARLRGRTGITGLCPYAFRHTWITNKLKAGVDVATVAALAGSSVRTILLVYAHVIRDEAHLMAAMSK